VKMILVSSSASTKLQVWEMKLSRNDLYFTFCSIISEDIVTKLFTRFARHILCKVLGFLSNVVNHWHVERPEYLMCCCSYGMFSGAECCLFFLFSI
jgi:hypothetical protein